MSIALIVDSPLVFAAAAVRFGEGAYEFRVIPMDTAAGSYMALLAYSLRNPLDAAGADANHSGLVLYGHTSRKVAAEAALNFR